MDRTNVRTSCNETKGNSYSGTVIERWRPDTLVIAGERTFLIGEAKFPSLSAVEEDLKKKAVRFSPMFYGEVQCILGYAAAGSEFQWMCIDAYGEVRRAGPALDLRSYSDHCKFLLSIGHAYQLITKMVDSVPPVPGSRAMFTEEIVGDRTMKFFPEIFFKSIKHLGRFCEDMKNRLNWIREAYKAGRTCSSLPIAKMDDTIRHDTFKVEISSVGYSPVLKTEQDTRMLAKSVCEALKGLHGVGLVHRDVWESNILHVSGEQFMLIDLETVAESPFQVPEGFGRFKEWSDDILEGSSYTPMSDLYQLGKLLQHPVPSNTTSSKAAQQFIGKLRCMEYTAATALDDPWLSNLNRPFSSRWIIRGN